MRKIKNIKIVMYLLRHQYFKNDNTMIFEGRTPIKLLYEFFFSEKANLSSSPSNNYFSLIL